MRREELLKSSNYWLAYIQNGLFNIINDYKIKNKLKDKDLAQKLGVTKGYISQIMNGDFDHKMSKLVELSLLCNKIPEITYLDLDKYIKDDHNNDSVKVVPAVRPIQYFLSVNSGDVFIADKNSVREIEKMISHQIPSDSNVKSETLAHGTNEYFD